MIWKQKRKHRNTWEYFMLIPKLTKKTNVKKNHKSSYWNKEEKATERVHNYT